MKKIAFIPALVVLASCSNDIPMVNLGIDDVYYVSRMQKLPLHPALTGAEYRWLNEAGDLLSTERDYIFVAAEAGQYNLSLEIVDDATPYHYDFTVIVTTEEIAYSPYISQVYEYLPAPGQFVNMVPQWNEGETEEDMLRKVEDAICGTNDEIVTLGAYGGYIVFGFDHTIVNKIGEKDFKILGNCFYQSTDGDKLVGSAEPGIVMVSLDRNCNGLPDDEWYELAGSDYSNPATLHNYSITYHRPDSNREVVSQGIFSDVNYILWEDSEGNREYLPQNTFHRQDYFPGWIDAESITFTGTCLPKNGIDVNGTGTNYQLYCFDWGYADNHPNTCDDLVSFDISWAIDKDGLPVVLQGIDFVKVYTAVNQYCGWIGETSTEICRAQDLHVE